MRRKRTAIISAIAFAALVAGVVWLAVHTFTRSTLTVEASVAYAPGDTQPVASAPLYLLDADMMRLALLKEGEPPRSPLEEKVFRENPNLRNLAAVMNARRLAAYSLGPDVVPFIEQSRPLWEPHVLQTVQTNSGGRASFSNLKPGQYWLMCRAATRDGGVAFWNLPITIERGENRVTLETFNALQCSSCKN